MSEPATKPPPRYLIRRLFAYYVDMAVAWLLLAMLLGLTGYNNFADNFDDRPGFSRSTSFNFGLNWAFAVGEFNIPISINSQGCADAAPALVKALMSDDENLRAKSMQICFTRTFGVPSAASAEWVLERQGADGKITEESGITELGFNDAPIKVSKLLGIVVLILMSALCGWKLKTTPGKCLLRIRFNGVSPERSLRREIIKNIPNLAVLVPLVPYDLAWLAAPETSLLGINIASLAILIAHIAAIAVLWLAPLRNSKTIFPWSKPGEVILCKAEPPPSAQPNTQAPNL